MNRNTSPGALLRKQSFVDRVRRRRSVALGLATATILLAACFDRGTGPNPRPSVGPLGFVGDPNFGSNNSSAAGSYDGVIDTVDGHASKLATAAGTFPHPTFITVNVSGIVNQVPRALPGDGISRGPTSADNGSLWGVMALENGDGTWWAGTMTTTLRAVGAIFPGATMLADSRSATDFIVARVGTPCAGVGQGRRTSTSPASTSA